MTQFLEAEQQLMVNIIHGSDTVIMPSQLSNSSHRAILSAANELRSEGVTPDLVTIHNKLKETNKAGEAGGATYLATLSEGYPVSNLEPYERIIKQGALRKQIRLYANSLLEGLELEISTEELLTKAQRDPLSFYLPGDKGKTFELQDAVFDALDDIRAKKEGKISGLMTPWNKLNEYTNGLQPSNLIVVAGRPSMGKTALGNQIALHAAKLSGPAFVGSLEMSRSSLCERVLSSLSKIDSNKIRGGFVTPLEIDRLLSAAESLQDYHPILVNDTPRLTASELRVLITQAHRKYGRLSCAVIDYLGLMKDEFSTNRVREVGEATKLMRATAKELEIPVVLLCQLNRSCELRDNKRPTLPDLRESGEIEQDADVVIMLYRDEYYCTDCAKGQCQEGHKGKAEILIRKQREGPTGAFTLTWISEYTSFYNYSHDSRRGDIR